MTIGKMADDALNRLMVLEHAILSDYDALGFLSKALSKEVRMRMHELLFLAA